jgi:Zn-dependent M28 family amino/carboxypeptidase
LEGSDSALKQQLVVVTAHVDAAGARGAVDASGVAALLAVARALSQPGARPKRSVLFVVSSGPDSGFAGAHAIAAHLKQSRARVAATLTLDLIGRAGDSVAVDGLDEIDFGTPSGWIASANADAGLTAITGSILTAPCADNCAFVRRKMPSLYLHDPGMGHDSGSAITSAPVDPAHTARMAGLAAALTRVIANAERAARWRAGALEQLGAATDE